MKNTFILLFPLFLWATVASGQYFEPSDSCGSAPNLCLNGLTTTMFGFKPGNEPITCPNGQAWGVHNDMWIAFTPVLTNLTITVDVVGNCSSGNGIQALIHESCSEPPIDCDVDCGGSPEVGAGINFVPGKTYYLRIDGCNAAVCPAQITVTPANALLSPPDPFQPKWPATGYMQGKNPIPCAFLEFSYNLPLNLAATGYHWTIESGEGEIINNQGDQYVDNNPADPGKDVVIVGPKRYSIKLRSYKDGQIRLCGEGTNGCYSTGKTCLNITVLKPAKEIKAVNICPNVKVFEDSTIFGGPFYPGSPCPSYQLYDATSKNAEGCAYEIVLAVAQQCDTVFNLGEIPLYADEKFKICDFVFDTSTTGSKTVICNARPKQDANIFPANCDSTKTFAILPIKIEPKLPSLNYKFHCADSKVTLDARKSTWTPNDTGRIKEVRYKWQRFQPAPISAWEDIAGATSDTLNVDSSGKYRIEITLDVNYEDGEGIKRSKSCSAISTEVLVSPYDTLPPLAPIIAHSTVLCSGKTYALSVKNPDPGLQYYWIRTPQNDTIGLSDTATVQLATADQVITLIAASACSQSSSTDTLEVNFGPAVPKLLGPTVVCANTPIEYCVEDPEATTKYIWKFGSQVALQPGPKPDCYLATWLGNASTGTIQIEATNFCGKISINYPIEIQPAPLVNLGADTILVKSGENTTVDAGSGGATYQWNSGATTSSIVVKEPSALYCVTVTNQFGCKASDCTFVKFYKTSTSDLSAMGINIFPNPTSDRLNISTTVAISDLMVQIFDVNGRRLYEQKIRTSETYIDVSDFASGVYVMKFVGDKVLAEARFVKQ